VQSADLPSFLFRPIRANVGSGTQAEGILPPIVDDAGVPKVEQDGKLVVCLVFVVALCVAMQRDLGKREKLPSIPCQSYAGIWVTP